MGRTPLIASLAILALLLSAGKTHATSTAIGSGSALIDWSSLTFTVFRFPLSLNLAIRPAL
jgi:hypothetical protein